MSRYSIGTGIHDVTGPAAECGMMGYSMVHQRTAGIHMRLRARAFIIGDDQKRLVFVTADLGMIFQGVSLAVLETLRGKYGDLYTVENVCLTATHTHAGPGGYSHYALYNLAPLGYDEDNFNVIVRGIVAAIDKAHRRYENSRPGKIRMSRGPVPNVGFNRSIEAYKNNPLDERERHGASTDDEMTLLRFEDDEGHNIAILNWFGLHATNLGNTNRLISPDNRGYAAYLVEKRMGANYALDDTYVAGFAQGACGDVSPNLWGYPDGSHDMGRMMEIGRRLFVGAWGLQSFGLSELDGPVDFRHRYLAMDRIKISGSWIQDGSVPPESHIRTCPAAIGISKLAGSTEDGKGFRFISEGMNNDGVYLPSLVIDDAIEHCHGEKAIILIPGKMKPHPWTPAVLPIQLLRIGPLGIAALPAECSTMAARRLRETIRHAMPELEHVVISSYANAYAGYVTTREEYAAQQYEGASTHFGPWTLNAYQQEFAAVAKAMREEQPVRSDVQPEDLRDAQVFHQVGVLIDGKPMLQRWGAVHREAKEQYIHGETVEVQYWGAHPKNNYMTQGSYLYVERRENSHWTVVARDGDPETIFKWKREGWTHSLITVRWIIPVDAEDGVYRIRHVGYRKGGKEYEGCSREFRVL